MSKKIKSFNVDDEVYKKLISIFKKYKAETSISMFINNELKALLHYIEQIQEGMKDTDYSFPISFVINEAVKGEITLRHLSFEPDTEDDQLPEIEWELRNLEEFYEADKAGIPREFYRWYKIGGYVLSKDKKFLIDKEGRKFIVRGSLLRQVIEVESKEIEGTKRK
jgi:hypothetical protein